MNLPVVSRDEAHNYRVDGDSRVFPSVTTVTSATFSKEAIRASVRRHAIEFTIAAVDADNRDVGRIEAAATRDSMKKADLGTAAHALFENFIEYVVGDPVGWYPNVPPDLTRHAAQFHAFENASGVRWLASEVPLVSRKYGFGGTLDALGMVPAYTLRRFAGDPYPTLVDFKTGARTYVEHVLQLAAYRQMLKEAGQDYPFAGILHVPGGEKTWEWVPIALTQRDLDAFLWRLDSYRWQLEREKEIRP